MREFEIGETLVFSIKKGKEKLSGIIGILKNIAPVKKKQFRCGVVFDFSANEYMYSDEVEKTLANIENSLNKRYSTGNRNVYRRLKNKM